jgi:hypothetical protein
LIDLARDAAAFAALAALVRSGGTAVTTFVPLSRGTVSPEIPPNASGGFGKFLHVVSAPVRP